MYAAAAAAKAEPTATLCIGGVSFGGLVAYEAARQLAAAGRDVQLFVVDTLAPGTRPSRRPLRSRLHLGRRRKQAAALMTWARTGRRPRALMLDKYLLADAHRRMMWRYRPTRPSPQSARLGSVFVVVTDGQVSASGRPDLGWAEFLGQDVAVERVPGPHMGLLEPDHAPAVAAALAACASSPRRSAAQDRREGREEP